MKLSRLALAIAVMPGLSLAAEPYVAEPLVVTSGRLAEPQAQATAATSVFTREDIERLQVRSVPQLLSRVPGVQIGSSGGVISYSVRGTSTAQTLVLIDGQRVASASSGIARLDYLSIDNVERLARALGVSPSVLISENVPAWHSDGTRAGS